jgi:plastocyanin
MAAVTVMASVSLALGPVAPVARGDGHEVAIRDGGYDPATLNVVAGEPVTWTNETSTDHSVTSDDGTLDSGPIGPGEAYGHVFDAPGTVAYHDTSPSGFKGTIVVNAALVTPVPSGSPEPTPPPGTLPPNFSPNPTPAPTASPEPSASPSDVVPTPSASAAGGSGSSGIGGFRSTALVVVVIGGVGGWLVTSRAKGRSRRS